MTSSREIHSCFAGGPSGCDHRLYPHAVQFYFDEQVLIRSISPFVASALKAGDGAFILATDTHQRALALQLLRDGIDVRAYASQGRYVTMDAAEVADSLLPGEADFSSFRLRVGCGLDAVNKAAANKNPRAMVFGELVSLLWERRDSKAVLDLEEVWNSVAKEHSFSLFCGYAIKEFAGEGSEDVLLQICDAHSTIVPPDQYPTHESERRITNALASYGR